MGFLGDSIVRRGPGRVSELQYAAGWLYCRPACTGVIGARRNGPTYEPGRSWEYNGTAFTYWSSSSVPCTGYLQRRRPAPMIRCVELCVWTGENPCRQLRGNSLHSRKTTVREAVPHDLEMKRGRGRYNEACRGPYPNVEAVRNPMNGRSGQQLAGCVESFRVSPVVKKDGEFEV